MCCAIDLRDDTCTSNMLYEHEDKCVNFLPEKIIVMPIWKKYIVKGTIFAPIVCVFVLIL